MQRQDGFTLIELLIVIAIMAILIGIVALSLGGLTDRANTTAKAAELDTVQMAIDVYNTQNVAVDGEAEIAAQPKPTTITAESASFAQYLRRDTKYTYAWCAGGTELTQDAVATCVE